MLPYSLLLYLVVVVVAVLVVFAFWGWMGRGEVGVGEYTCLAIICLSYKCWIHKTSYSSFKTGNNYITVHAPNTKRFKRTLIYFDTDTQYAK